jgi:glycosyltransferase involved in cell wall biosynthesis
MNQADSRRPLPILALLNNFMIGGTERHVVGLAKALDRARFELHLACFRRTGELLEEVEEAPLTLREYPIRRLYGPRALARQADFARYLRRHGIRIVSTYGFYSNVFGIPAARAAGVPVVLASVRDQGDHLTPLQRRVQRLVCRLAHGVLVNSQAVRDRLLADGWNPRRISVIPNGVELTSSSREEVAAIRRELGLPLDSPVVGVFGRLTPLKGLEYFVDAAATVARRVAGARFLVVGNDREGPAGYSLGLEARARALGLSDRIVFAGLRIDVPRLLGAVDVSVQPSLSEGLSNVLLESMAAGIPVVATHAGGNGETVEDGVSGLLVPPRDASCLADAILRILDDGELAKRLGSAGRERVARRFSRERMVRETEALYLRFLGRSARGRTGRSLAAGMPC